MLCRLVAIVPMLFGGHLCIGSLNGEQEEERDMTRSLLAVSGAVALLAASGAAQAQLYVTSFENTGGIVTPPNFSTGNVVGQNSWQGSSNLFTVTSNAGQALTGSQFLQFDTTALGTNTAGAAAFAWIDNPVTTAQLATSPIVRAGTSVFIASGGSPATGAGVGRVSGAFLDSFSLTTGTRIASLGLQSSGVFVARSAPSAGTGAVGFTLTTNALDAIGIWWDVRTELNFTSRTISYFVNGTDITSFLTGIGLNNTFTQADFGDADLNATRFARPTGPNGNSAGGHTLRYDNYFVEVVPTPSAAALLGLGGLVAGRRRRA